MKPFIQDGHILALRAIRAALGETDTRLVIEGIETIDWASATFVGKRHRCQIRIEGGEDEVARAVECLSRELPEADVATTAYFLADAMLCGFDLVLGGAQAWAAVVVEALTIEV